MFLKGIHSNQYGFNASLHMDVKNDLCTGGFEEICTFLFVLQKEKRKEDLF